MKTNRRSFIAGMGGLVAASALPGFAAEEQVESDPALFPQRGKFERLVLAYQHVHVGLAKPFSVLHISDTHLASCYPDEGEKKHQLMEKRRRTFGGRQEEALRDSLAWAKERVDYVIHTGDLIDWQSRANFDLVRKYYGSAAGFMVGSLGNHEYSPDMWLSDPKESPTEDFKDRTRAQVAAAYPFDVSVQSTVVNGVDFVTFDDVYGTVTAEQAERIKAEFKKGLPVVLCMHVPFFSEHIGRAHDKFWRWTGRFTGAAVEVKGDYKRQLDDRVTADLLAFLRRQEQLKAILAGHLHITVQDRFSPTAMQYVVGGNFMFHGEEVLFT